MNTIKICLLAIAVCFAQLSANAQYNSRRSGLTSRTNKAVSSPSIAGIRVGLMQPRGDIGNVYKRAPVFDIYYAVDYTKTIRVKAGISYTATTARADTFHNYMVKDAYPDEIIPGYSVYHRLSMFMFYIEDDFRLINYKNITWNAGIGIVLAQVKYKADYGYETTAEGGETVNSLTGGLRFNTSIGYYLDKHMQLFAQYTHNAITMHDWSQSFSNSSYALGFNYCFSKFKNYKKKKTK
jgi:hypothetical protein